MKILILIENLEVNRTSSGIRSYKQLILYQKIYGNIDVITATDEKLHPKIKDVKYFYLKEKYKYNYSWIDKLSKSIAIQNFVFGIGLRKYYKILNWKNTIKDILNTKKYNYIVSLDSGSSFISAYALYFLRKKYSFKHLMFVHDPFPLNQYPKPYQKPNSLPYKSVARLFGKVLATADILSFPSLRLMEWMSQFYPEIPDKHIIQPHIGMRLDELNKFLVQKETSDIPVLPKGLNIVHTGSLLGSRNPTFLIKAIELLFKNFPEAKEVVFLHIIGQIDRSWDPKKLCTDNVIIYPKRYSYLQSLEIQKKADILLLIEAVSEVSPFMPGKLADYLMAEKPILALTPKTSESSRILGKYYTLLCENGNIEDIYNKLQTTYHSYQKNSLNELLPYKKAKKYVESEQWIENTRKINFK